MLAAYPDAIRVANKCDLSTAWDVASRGALCMAASSGTGVDALRRAIAAKFGLPLIDLAQLRATDFVGSAVRTASPLAPEASFRAETQSVRAADPTLNTQGHFAAPQARWWTQRQRDILNRAIDHPQALAEIWR